MTKIVFIDAETTSLRPDRRAWEVGLITRETGVDSEHSWFIDGGDLDLGNADLMSLKIGRFHQRHPDFQSFDHDADPFDTACARERYVLDQVERLTRGAILVGAVPNFDAEVLGARMRAHGICPARLHW